MITAKRLLPMVLVVSILTAGAAVTWAQAPPTDSKKSVLESQWVDFLHYIRIGKGDVARSFGEAIIDSGKPREVYLLSVKYPRSLSTLGRAERLEGMEDIVKSLREMIEKGYEGERADPKHIAKSIEMLGGTTRAYALAVERLKRSGEYAMPQLVQRLMDPKTPEKLRPLIHTVFSEIGKAAVRPLTVALQTSDPGLQEVFAWALFEIKYPHAAAQLKELYERKNVLERTRKTAKVALTACAGEDVLDKPVAQLYYDLALKYYYRHESVLPDSQYPTANVWYWKKGLGLDYKPVPREIFCDIYAMRMSRLALKHDPKLYTSISLWIAANLNREANLPDGVKDPTRKPGEPSARYYALASGAKYLQDVLARVVDDRNTAVTVGAIEALARTAGAKNLVRPVAGGASPLVEALTYPDRRVRFLAAASLTDALPQQQFKGHEMVIPVLMEALRQTGKKTALIIVSDEKKTNLLKDGVRAAGYDVIVEAKTEKALSAAVVAGGVDVVVLGDDPQPNQVVASLRSKGQFVGLPVVVAGQSERLGYLAEKDGRVVLTVDEPQAKDMAEALSSAANIGAGEGMSPKLAAKWAVRTAESIRMLGLTGNSVYDIDSARVSLAAALQHPSQDVQVAAARALAVMPKVHAQRAITAVACSTQTSEKVRIEAFASLTESIRRFGSQVPDDQAENVIGVVIGNDSLAVRSAAAQALGAMNLPSEKIKSLILTTVGQTPAPAKPR